MQEHYYYALIIESFMLEGSLDVNQPNLLLKGGTTSKLK